MSPRALDYSPAGLCPVGQGRVGRRQGRRPGPGTGFHRGPDGGRVCLGRRRLVRGRAPSRACRAWTAAAADFAESVGYAVPQFGTLHEPRLMVNLLYTQEAWSAYSAVQIAAYSPVESDSRLRAVLWPVEPHARSGAADARPGSAGRGAAPVRRIIQQRNRQRRAGRGRGAEVRHVPAVWLGRRNLGERGGVQPVGNLHRWAVQPTGRWGTFCTCLSPPTGCMTSIPWAPSCR